MRSDAKLEPWTLGSIVAGEMPASSLSVLYSDTSSTTVESLFPTECCTQGARIVRCTRTEVSNTDIFSHKLSLEYFVFCSGASSDGSGGGVNVLEI